MRRFPWMASFVWMGILALCQTISFAEEHDSKYFQKQFDHWSKVIADLKASDTGEDAGQDIELIRTWIGQAQAFLASEKTEAIEPLLKKIEAQAEYIRAKLNRLAAESSASDAEQQAQAAEDAAKKSQQTLDSAQKRIQELEGQGL